MAIAFIDAAPVIESKNGHHLVTFDSGGDEIKLMLTRHALFMLAAKTVTASKESNEAEPPTHFRRVSRKGRA